mmetsp:Transcript_19291/g.35459  ORF Transcript_19291/g.35459 Transcript_19291/m.35459 type:complete len:349 (+) Transcript_19291:6056-7102(+)
MLSSPQSKLKSREMSLSKNMLDREEHILALEEDRKLKEENAAKREERQKRQLEITEKAANEDRDAEEKRIRTSLYVHRFWGRFLQNKLQAEMQQSTAVEEAFQKIRITTGFSEINEVVERYLTREQTYSQLVANIAQNEQLLAKKTELNSELEDKIRKLKNVYTEDARAADAKEVARLTKENLVTGDKLTRVSVAYQKVVRWVVRMKNKLTAAETGEAGSMVSQTELQEIEPSLGTEFGLLKELAHMLIVFIANNKQDLRKRLESLNTEKLKELAVKTRQDQASTILSQRKKLDESFSKGRTSQDIEEDKSMMDEFTSGRKSIKRRVVEVVEGERRRQEKLKKRSEKP